MQPIIAVVGSADERRTDYPKPVLDPRAALSAAKEIGHELALRGCPHSDSRTASQDSFAPTSCTSCPRPEGRGARIACAACSRPDATSSSSSR